MSHEANNGAEAIREAPLLLVIDDDMIQRTIIAKIGTQAGFKVTAVASYDAAADTLKRQKFDCVTLDLSLGEQSGALLLQTIVDTGNKVPVVIISGAEDHVLQTTVKMALELDLETAPFRKPLNLVAVRQTLAMKCLAAKFRANAGEQRASA